jgi:glycosyltransferase involved in cell wall biosynthesis
MAATSGLARTCRIEQRSLISCTETLGKPVRNVLFTMTTADVVGGVQTRQARLAPLLPARGWRAIFALAWGARFHDPQAFRAAYPGLETVLLDGRSGTGDGRRLAIRKAIRNSRAAIVVPGMMIDTFEVMRELKVQGSDVRLLAGLYGINTQVLLPLKHYQPILDQAFAVSRLTEQFLHRVCGMPADRVHYVPTGIPAARRMASRVGDRPLRVGLIGRLDPEKRPMDLVGLLEQLDLRQIGYQVTVVGEGSLGQEVRLALEPWVDKRLVIRPPMSMADLYEHVYPQLDVALLFSPSEGVPNVLMEGMAHGVVPVTSDFRGRVAQGLIRHGETGLVFPVGDVAAAAECLSLLTKSTELHERVSRNARSAVEVEHAMEGMADTFAEVLNRTITEPSRFGPVPSRLPAREGRLDRYLGARGRECLRRLLCRRYLHADASEWPLHYGWPDDLVESVEGTSREETRRAEADDGPARWPISASP